MKKVMLITEAMLGGIRQHILDITRGLNREKYEVWLVYSDNRADDKFFEEIEEVKKRTHLIKCNEMQRSIGKQDIKAYWKLKQIIKDVKPDIVHCHSSKAGIVGRLSAKRCKVPLILYTPNAYAFQNPSISKTKKLLYISAERFLSRYMCDYTINVSKGEKVLAISYKIAKEDKLKLIYNGIEDKEILPKEELRKKLNLDINKKYIGVTARCAKQKDPFTFLEIAQKIVGEKDNVEFIYVGDGEMEKEMQLWIKEHNLQDKIHMLGFRSDAAEVVGALDIYLSTALYEGLPYSMIEAMRAGVPLIATDTVGNNELVFEGINGMMYPIGNLEKAVELINKQLCTQIISSVDVRNTFNREFSLEGMIKKLEKLYEGKSNI